MIKRTKTIVKFCKLPHYVENEANLCYATNQAACFDICAAIAEPFVLKAGQRAGIPTAIKTVPEGDLWFRVNSRSGLAFKHGIITIGGIIDADYRGEWFIGLLNTSDTDYVINAGDKIAQVELPFPYMAEFLEVSLSEYEALSETERGAGGFGSSGR